MDPVVHFELPAENKERTKKFYSKAFGWKTEQLGKEMGEYVVVTTTEVDKNMMPKETGRINGGFYQKTDDPISQHPSVVISVEDIRAAMKRVEEAGGKVLGEPQEIPNVGTFVSFIDTEGNRLSIIQPRMK